MLIQNVCFHLTRTQKSKVFCFIINIFTSKKRVQTSFLTTSVSPGIIDAGGFIFMHLISQMNPRLAAVLLLPPCGRGVQQHIAHLHVSVDFLHELFLLLLSHINLLHVVPEVHVLKSRKLLFLYELHGSSVGHSQEDEHEKDMKGRRDSSFTLSLSLASRSTREPYKKKESKQD